MDTGEVLVLARPVYSRPGGKRFHGKLKPVIILCNWKAGLETGLG